MKFIVNIGLDIAATSTISADVARQIVVANDFLIGDWKVLQSDTEPTLVAEVTSLCQSPLMVLANLHSIATDLKQDCIAVYRKETKGGALIGPNAKAWGSFSPAYFFNLDGSRLGQTASA